MFLPNGRDNRSARNVAQREDIDVRHDRQVGLRTRIALFFVLIGALSVGMLVGAGLWLGTRIEDPALSTALSGIAMAGFAICGLVAWVAAQMDEKLARPLEAILAEMRSFAETGGTSQPRMAKPRDLGLLEHDAKALATVLEKAGVQAPADATVHRPSQTGRKTVAESDDQPAASASA